MHYMDTIFGKILKVVPRYRFERVVEKHGGDFRVRNFRCWDQFVSLLYGQFTGRKSLRDIELSFNSQSNPFYHLGCNPVKRSTLADANNRRPVKIYEELFELFLRAALPDRSGEAAAVIKLLDSTTISLNETRFGWALGAGIKLHMVYDLDAEVPVYFAMDKARGSDLAAAKEIPVSANSTYVFDRGYYDFSWWNKLNEHGAFFVTRLKSNSPTFIVKENQVGDENILSDNEVKLNKRLGKGHKNPYSGNLREVIVKIEGKKEPIRIITNNLKSPAAEIAELYKKRWQIELFFKWIKQNLKIKTFLGTSENAVKIQVIIAMIAFLILRIISATLPIKITMQNLARLIHTNITERKSWPNLLSPPATHKKTNITNQFELLYA